MTKCICLTLAICLLGIANARSATNTNSNTNANTNTNTHTNANTHHQHQHQHQHQHHHRAADGQARQHGAAASTGIWKDLSLAFRVYKQCAQENLSVCLKVKLLAGLERAMRSGKVLQLVDGVQLVQSDEANERMAKEPPAAAGAAAGATATQSLYSSEQDIEAVLPRSLEAKEQTLREMIISRLTKLLRDRVLYIHMPFLDYNQPAEELNGNSVEGRKKKDKKGGGGAYIMIPLLLGGTFVPIAYGALAMLAGKALIVSKLALVLASIIGIKKLLSGGGGKESSHEVVVSSGGHSGWGRDMDLAYSGWKPAKELPKAL